MKKLIAAILAALTLCVGCFLSACSLDKPEEPKQPLTQTDCFKDLIMFQRFKQSNKPQGYEEVPVRGENLSLSELVKVENQIPADKYSYFLIYTTDKAAHIKVTSITFNIIAAENCNVQFSLEMGENDLHYSATVELTANEPSEVSFEGLQKTWSEEDAGNSQLYHSDATTYPVVAPEWDYLVGTANTFIKINLMNKSELIENAYSIQNLQVNFEELEE